MADIYDATQPPMEYDPVWLGDELRRIAAQLQEMEIPRIVLTPVYLVPSKPTEGMVVNADGTHWNPGSGAGLYQYLSSAWVKL